MVWILCLCALFLSSCGHKPQERHYKEIIIEPEAAAPAAGIPVASPGLSWDLPQGWKQIPADGMRLASFQLLVHPQSFDCYILALPGAAGGMEANLKRWLGQLGLTSSDADINKLLATSQVFKTRDGVDAKVFDFTVLYQQDTDKSMLAAIINLGDTTVFVKMTGAGVVLRQNKDDFLKLIGSLR